MIFFFPPPHLLRGIGTRALVDDDFRRQKVTMSIIKELMTMIITKNNNFGAELSLNSSVKLLKY